MALGLVGDHHRQGGLAGARRAPQDDGREQPVGLDGAAQQLTRAQDVLLPNVLIKRAGRSRAASGASVFMRCSWAWVKRSMMRFPGYARSDSAGEGTLQP